MKKHYKIVFWTPKGNFKIVTYWLEKKEVKKLENNSDVIKMEEIK